MSFYSTTCQIISLPYYVDLDRIFLINFCMRDLKTNLNLLIEAAEKTRELADSADKICAALANCIRGGGTIFTCGNGGSAADAMHFAEELTGKYKAVRRPLRGICINSDAAALTCIANDFGYESVFSRQLEALGRKSDAVLIFTTSGNSANQIAVLKKAKELGITSVVLSGRGGGECSKISDLSLVVPSDDGARIQEIHGVILHTIIEAIEDIV